jgi:TRAP-type C4-dicarboxylate transport system substrate-binding protein
MKGMGFRGWVIGALVVLSSSVRADPVTLRMASAVPEGTAWAREGHAFARDVEALTEGQVRVKWYLGSIAGDELQVADRIHRNQLDGTGSGGMLCTRLSPSMRAIRQVGLLRSRAEANYVTTRLKPTLDEEFAKAGFVNLFETVLGPDLAFTREPVRTFEQLKKARMWVWDLDDVVIAPLTAMGFNLVPLPLGEAARAYESGRSDGFLGIPVAALAFQWSAQVRYLNPMPIGYLTGCMIIAQRAFDALPLETQKAVKTAAAKFYARMDAMGGQQDEALMTGAFAHQGVQQVRPSEELQRTWYERAKAIRESFGDRIAPAALRKRVDDMLDEFRHSGHTKN